MKLNKQFYTGTIRYKSYINNKIINAVMQIAMGMAVLDIINNAITNCFDDVLNENKKDVKANE